ncbi:hypothetical protein HYU93_04860 [Candidatus Daviesbacteria bacterium]|nr:hypothetical protein [Candidatus Daviesbacteria bacterium]
MEVKVFTYSKLEAFDGIKKRGLIPQSRLIPGTNSELGIFGLLDPQPAEWVNNPEYPQVWGRLVFHLTPLSWDPYKVQGGDFLLELSVDPQKLAAYIIDWAPMERYEITRGKLERQLVHAEAYGRMVEYNQCWQERARLRLRAQQLRRESMMPLTSYLELRPDGRLERVSLPEVVILKPVPTVLIGICSQQPLLLRRLKSTEQDATKQDAIKEIQLAARRHPEIAECPALTQYLVD